MTAAAAPAPSPPAASAADGPRSWVARALPFVPALLGVVACLAAVVFADGAYFPRHWYPGGLLAGALLVVVAVARPAAARPPEGSRLGLALLAGWIALSGLSIAWASTRGAAWESTDQLLATLAVALLVALAPWRTRSAWLLFGAWAGAVALIAAVDLTSFALTAHPERRLLESRYLGPVGYANGTAALAALAFWPALLASARPRTPWPARLALAPVAALLLAWSLLPQSRGTMLALVAVTPLALALGRHRWRLLARLLVVSGAVAPAVGPLFDVYTASREARPLAPVVDAVAGRVLLAVVLALAGSALLLVLERHVRPSPSVQAMARRAARVALAGALVAAVVVAVAARGPIGDGLRERWDAFNSVEEQNVQTGARIGQITSDKRSDAWRVALEAFRDRPLVGIGAGGFERRYTAEKRYAKHSRYVHNLWLRALAETGAVGLALLAGGLLALLGALARRRRTGADAELLAAAGAAAAGFFLQCSVDWLEQVTVLPAVALWLVLVALAATSGRAGAARSAASATQRAPDARSRERLLALPTLALGLVTLVALLAPWLAVRALDRGDALRATNPRGAYAAYDQAAWANPLNPAPRLSAGFLALDLGDTRGARRAFEQALDVEEGWVAELELGLLDLQAGRFAAAAPRVARAAALNRHDPVIAAAQAALRERRRVDPRAINRIALQAPVLQGG